MRFGPRPINKNGVILSFVNVKGGVGKTTTAVNLSAVFGQARLKTLLVDLDPQASATYALGFPADSKGTKIKDVLLDDAPATEAIVETSVKNVDLMRGDLGMAAADLALARRKDPATRLLKVLEPLEETYHAILVDSPAGLSLLSLMALHACSAYVVPTTPHHLALDALERFFDGVKALKSDIMKTPRLLGVALTMVDRRTNLAEELISELRAEYKQNVFRTEIPVNVRLAEASGYGTTIFDYEPGSSGAAAYRRLGAEVLRRLREKKLV